MKRVVATDDGKQYSTSMARQNSGQFCSPNRPLHGKAPLQQVYLLMSPYSTRSLQGQRQGCERARLSPCRITLRAPVPLCEPQPRHAPLVERDARRAQHGGAEAEGEAAQSFHRSDAPCVLVQSAPLVPVAAGDARRGVADGLSHGEPTKLMKCLSQGKSARLIQRMSEQIAFCVFR